MAYDYGVSGNRTTSFSNRISICRFSTAAFASVAFQPQPLPCTSNAVGVDTFLAVNALIPYTQFKTDLFPRAF